MANFFKLKDRRVIPNFRSLQKTAQTGGLKSSLKDIQRNLVKDPHIDSLKADWIAQKSLGVASEILSTGLLVDPDGELVKEASIYVLNANKASKSQKMLSRHILSKEITQVIPERTLDWFIEENHKRTIYKRIAKYKKQSIDFPRDALNYVELSRLYLILGQEEQAKKNILIALNLGGQNRYILRSAVRLFVHTKDFEIAQYFLRRYKYLKFDPQILSAEIALSTLRERFSPFIKHGQGLIDLNKFSASGLTELSAALGTVELIDGSLKKSRKYFETALLDPNDNSLAQVEWATNEAAIFNLNIFDYNEVAHNYEALTIDSYYSDNWQGVIDSAEKWFIDAPFSTRPVRMASFVSLAYLDRQELAIKFCKAGLTTHPGNPRLINDLAYSLGLLNKTDEAINFINQIDIKSVSDPVVKNVLTATNGLIEFRKGNNEVGRALYLKSIEGLINLKKKELSKVATLNYIREEILHNPKAKNQFRPLLEQVASQQLDVILLKKRVGLIMNQSDT